MPRKPTSGGLGSAICNSKKQRAKEAKSRGGYEPPPQFGSSGTRSVLEQTSLDSFLQVAELAQADFEAVRGRQEVLNLSETQLVTPAGSKGVDPLSILVPIPRRPKWNRQMSADEINSNEGIAFAEWRQTLAEIEEENSIVMTPYEKNLDFWRQLWRVVERSDLLVQILDSRDPMFYRCRDLERYITEVDSKKQHLILLNKADFLSPELRSQWKAFAERQGVEVLFFSALRELRRQQHLHVAQDRPSDAYSAQPVPSDAEVPELGPYGAYMDDPDISDCEMLFAELHKRLSKIRSKDGAGAGVEAEAESVHPTVGFVGYPNVGKSSVINALFGSKKTSTSRQPGKTKHFQTLPIPEREIVLCDCPGLVFPSVVASRAHLIINATMPLDQLISFLEPIELVIKKVGAERLAEHYGCSAELNEAKRELRNAADYTITDAAHLILCAFARNRRHFLRDRVPDETWAAQRILKDICTGAVVHCEPPPGSSDKAEAVHAEPSFRPPPRTGAGAGAAADPDLDDSDLDDFLREVGDNGKDGNMTKRKARFLQKKMQKGGAPQVKVAGGAQVRGKVGFSSYGKTETFMKWA